MATSLLHWRYEVFPTGQRVRVNHVTLRSQSVAPTIEDFEGRTASATMSFRGENVALKSHSEKSQLLSTKCVVHDPLSPNYHLCNYTRQTSAQHKKWQQLQDTSFHLFVSNRFSSATWHYCILTSASQEILDQHDVPFVNRDKCAAFFVDYAKCMDKGTSYCSGPKDKFYECQYVALKQRLEKH